MAVIVQNVSHVYADAHTHAEVVALDNISMEIEDGRILAVVGKSGCGKSTLLNILSDLLKPTSGTARLTSAGKDSHNIGYVFQSPRLLPWRTVRSNIAYGLHSLNLDKEEAEQRVDHYIKLVDLWDFRDRFPATLSGGMQQRVAIARALARQPAALLMDEPFASLDEFTARALRTDLVSIMQAQEQTVVFVTHNIAEAAYLADRVVVMSPRPGRIRAVIDVDLPHPRRIESTEMLAYQREILGLLEDG